MGHLGDRLLAAVEAGDIEAVRGLYASDARVWHNFDGVEQTVEENLRVLAWLTGHVRDLHYDNIRRHDIPGGFVQQHVLRCRSRAGVELAVPACMVVRVADDRITRLDEYLDSAQVAALVGRVP